MELLRHISSYCPAPIMVSALGFQSVKLHFLLTTPFQYILSFVIHLLSASNASYCQRVPFHLLRLHTMILCIRNQMILNNNNNKVLFLINNPEFYNHSKKTQNFLFISLQHSHSHSYELPQAFTLIFTHIISSYSDNSSEAPCFTLAHSE